jgi:precorrin-3B methylase
MLIGTRSGIEPNRKLKATVADENTTTRLINTIGRDNTHDKIVTTSDIIMTEMTNMVNMLIVGDMNSRYLRAHTQEDLQWTDAQAP